MRKLYLFILFTICFHLLQAQVRRVVLPQPINAKRSVIQPLNSNSLPKPVIQSQIPLIMSQPCETCGGGGSGCNLVAGIVTGAEPLCAGANSITLTLSGNHGTFTWQESTDNVNFTSLITLPGTLSHTETNLSTTTYFRVQVSGDGCITVYSPSVEVIVSSSVIPGTITGGGSVCTGSAVPLTLDGNTSGSSVQWQSSSNNVNFNNIGGATGNSYTATNVTATTYYRALITDGNCSQTTAVTPSVQVSVNSGFVTAGTISGGGGVVCGGSNSTLLTVSGYTTGALIQWYSSIDNQNFSPIPNATTETYSAANISTTTYYSVMVNANCTNALTPSVQISVTPGITWVLDVDNDGHYTGSPTTQCSSPGAGWVQQTTQQAGDCDDNDPNVWQSQLLYVDRDGDDYDAGTQVVCYGATIPAGYSLTTKGSDCNDNDPSVWQSQLLYVDQDGDGYDNGQQTVCYGLTIPTGYSQTTNGSDCNDQDPKVHSPFTFYWDDDHDGYGDPNNSITSCAFTPPKGYVTNGNDCDDDNSAINPITIWYKDLDNDGYSDGTSQTQCSRPGNYKLPSELTATSGDCDDNNASVNPTLVWYRDADNDGYSDGTTQTQCARPTGYKLASELTATSGDCDDSNAGIHSSQTYYLDADKDGYGNPAKTISVCSSTPPTGYVKDNTDCNDNDAKVHSAQTYYLDADKDGYGNPAKTISVCSSTPPTGYVKNNTDCNDNNILIHAPVKYFVDNDRDGYGSQTTAMLCTLLPPPGYSINNLDCNDNNAAVHPFSQEICGNGIDDNCNGQVDEGCIVCKNATAFSTINITSSSAKLNWTASANPVQWQVDYKKSSSSSWKSIVLPPSSRSATISSLSSNQTYNWRIRALCGKTWTGYSAVMSFKTLSGSSGSGTESRVVPETTETSTNLEVRAMPNPTNTNFSINVKGNRQTDVIKMFVVDMYGRIIEQRTLPNEQTITLGDDYRPGVYIVKFIQGDQSKQLKLIKLPQ